MLRFDSFLFLLVPRCEYSVLGASFRAIIFMRWVKYGWLVGKISEKFTTATPSMTPRLFNKFNYRIKWFDGWENHMLILDNYSSGLSAPYKSWCLLEKVVEEA